MSDFVFSEHGEDILIHRLLLWKENGFYVDCGAYHPRKMSMTARLRNFGWRGINIDVDERVISLFERELPLDINLNIAITEKNCNVILQRYEDPVINTISEEQQKHLNHIEENDELFTNKLDKKVVLGKSLKTILEEHEIHHIDFLNLDIEEAEFGAIKGFPWDKIKPTVIACEMHRLDLFKSGEHKVVKFLKKEGYILQSYVFHTAIFIRDDFDTELCHRIPFKRL